ncbi:uncharacterized protein RBU33_020486 isoform 2-T3 [Hipposideros larvatus]
MFLIRCQPEFGPGCIRTLPLARFLKSNITRAAPKGREQGNSGQDPLEETEARRPTGRGCHRPEHFPVADCQKNHLTNCLFIKRKTSTHQEDCGKWEVKHAQSGEKSESPTCTFPAEVKQGSVLPSVPALLLEVCPAPDQDSTLKACKPVATKSSPGSCLPSESCPGVLETRTPGPRCHSYVQPGLL